MQEWGLDNDSGETEYTDPRHIVRAFRSGMRIRYFADDMYVLYEPIVGTGGGIRFVPNAPSACVWYVPNSASEGLC